MHLSYSGQAPLYSDLRVTLRRHASTATSKIKMLRKTNDLCERRTIIKICINEDETKLGKKSFPEV